MFAETNKTAAYLRLSREDGDKMESDSIKNQREMIRDYISKHEGLNLVDEYVDDGFSGTNFERPSFKRLMEDINSGKINCIIVKDLSRLGRNYIETGKYLERLFPALGIRFISILDHYDNKEESDDAEQFIIPFKNLINDAYCRDLSTKIRSQFDVRRRNGKFVGGFASYGYMKDPKDKNHLVIDPPAADIVRMIFRMKLDGYNQLRIAEKLNQMGVLPPAEYKRAQGLNFDCGFRSGKNPKWEYNSVLRILTNEMYIGNMVQGKTTKVNYKVKKIQHVPKEKWFRVENTHEAIIDKSVFEDVQRLMKYDTRTDQHRDKVYLFSGFAFCGDCGQSMNHRIARVKDKRYYYLQCTTFKYTKQCSSHLFREDKLEKIVLETIRAQIALVLKADEILKRINHIPESQAYVKTLSSQIVETEAEVERYREMLNQLYADKIEGIISPEEYMIINQRFTEKMNSAEEKVKVLVSTKQNAMKNKSQERQWIESFRKYQNIEKLERCIIVALIDHIVIYDKKHISVIFRFQDEMQQLLALAGIETEESRVCEQ